jgi:hypothetical protein
MINEVIHLEKLNDEEINFLPTLKRVLLKTNPKKPLYAKDIVRGVNKRREDGLTNYCLTKPFTEARLRKMVNYFRCTATLPVISTSNGYYVSYERDEIIAMIKSLRARADAIYGASDGMDYILKQKDIVDGNTEIDVFGFEWKD